MALPSIGTSQTATPRQVLMSDIGAVTKQRGVVIDASEARDPTNTGDLDTLQAGILLGKITSGNYAPSIMGVTTVAYDVSASPLQITVGAATAVELVRREGSSGTFKLTGPPTASGTVQTATVTYSAVNTTTGVITVTTLTAGADEVHTITFDAAMTAGVLDVTYFSPDGEPINAAVPWDTNISTTIAAWNVASTDAATDVMGEASVGAVMTGDATNPVLTYSGVGFAKLAPSQLAIANVDSTTGPVDASTAQTTAAVGLAENDFVAGSFVQPDDGSETITCILGDEYGVKVTDEDSVETDTDAGCVIFGGQIDTGKIVNYPTDASLKAHIKTALRAAGIGYVFKDDVEN